MKVLLVALCAFALTQATARNLTWNTLLNAQGIFPAEIDAIKSRSGDGATVLSELENLLSQPNVLYSIYSNYMENFGKSSIRAKNTANLRIFQQNLVQLADHNLKAQQGEYSWVKAVNQFTDMTEDEVQEQYTGYQVDLTSSLRNSSLPISHPRVVSSARAAASIDWRGYGVVSSIKNQGGCGSCVPFAAAAALESSHALWHNGQILDLSEQELIDCSRGNGNSGCVGGTFVPTFDYLRNNGLSTEGEYPYEERDNTACRSGGKSHPARVTGWWPVEPHGDENALVEAISLYGPIAVAIHANGDFQAYGGGIFEAPCQGGRNHAVLAIGYGNENGRDYFIVKNSWGNWGEGGFGRIRRNYGNMCDIAGDAVLINA